MKAVASTGNATRLLRQSSWRLERERVTHALESQKVERCTSACAERKCVCERLPAQVECDGSECTDDDEHRSDSSGQARESAIQCETEHQYDDDADAAQRVVHQKGRVSQRREAE